MVNFFLLSVVLTKPAVAWWAVSSKQLFYHRKKRVHVVHELEISCRLLQWLILEIIYFYLKSNKIFILFLETDTYTYMNRRFANLKTSARIVHSACDNVDRFIFTRLVLSQLRNATVFMELHDAP